MNERNMLKVIEYYCNTTQNGTQKLYILFLYEKGKDEPNKQSYYKNSQMQYIQFFAIHLQRSHLKCVRTVRTINTTLTGVKFR